MLNKQSEKFLKFVLSKYDGNIENDIIIYPSDLNINFTELNFLCRSLLKHKLICGLDCSSYQKEPVRFTLSYHAIHYFENKPNWFSQNWLGVLTLAVSIATLIVTAIK